MQTKKRKTSSKPQGRGEQINVKEEIKQAESELKGSYRNLKALGINNPKSFVRDSVGYNIEDVLGYASYQIGRIEILQRLARGAKPNGEKNK